MRTLILVCRMYKCNITASRDRVNIGDLRINTINTKWAHVLHPTDYKNPGVTYELDENSQSNGGATRIQAHARKPNKRRGRARVSSARNTKA